MQYQFSVVQSDVRMVQDLNHGVVYVRVADTFTSTKTYFQSSTFVEVF